MKTIITLLLVNFQHIIIPELSPTISSKKEISFDIQQQVIMSVSIAITRYNQAGNCFDVASGTFEEGKYRDFIALFNENALALDDLSFSKKLLPYSQYAQKIFDNLREFGVPFILEEVVVDKIDIDDAAFYIIDVNLTKRLSSG